MNRQYRSVSLSRERRWTSGAASAGRIREYSPASVFESRIFTDINILNNYEFCLNCPTVSARTTSTTSQRRCCCCCRRRTVHSRVRHSSAQRQSYRPPPTYGRTLPYCGWLPTYRRTARRLVRRAAWQGRQRGAARVAGSRACHVAILVVARRCRSPTRRVE